MTSTPHEGAAVPDARGDPRLVFGSHEGGGALAIERAHELEELDTVST